MLIIIKIQVLTDVNNFCCSRENLFHSLLISELRLKEKRGIVRDKQINKTTEIVP